MKSRRDITLGEMQDECKRVFGGCALCRVKNECAFCLDVQPAEIDLTDAPRFTEAQMAFWRGWYEMGAKSAYQNEEELYFYNGDQRNSHTCLGSTRSHISGIWIKNGETLDLAEMFGKEETK